MLAGFSEGGAQFPTPTWWFTNILSLVLLAQAPHLRQHQHTHGTHTHAGKPFIHVKKVLKERKQEAQSDQKNEEEEGETDLGKKFNWIIPS